MFTEIIHNGYLFKVNLEPVEIELANQDEHYLNQISEKYFKLFHQGMITAKLAEAQAYPVKTKIEDAEIIYESNQSDTEIASETSSICFSWTDRGTRLFISELEVYLPLVESGKLNYKKMFEKIVATLQKHCVNVSEKQCSTKLASLKRQYKAVKDHNKKSGNDRKTWIYFDLMDKIFGERSWVSPETVESNSVPSVRKTEDPSKGEHSKRLKTYHNARAMEMYVKFKESEKEQRRQQHQEKMEKLNKIASCLERLTSFVTKDNKMSI